MDGHVRTTVELKKSLTKANDARYRTKIRAEFHLLAKALGVQEATTSRLCLLETANWHILQFQELLRKKSNADTKNEGYLDKVKGKFLGIIQKNPFFFKKVLVPEDIGHIVGIKKVISKNKHSSLELRTQEIPVLPAIATRRRQKEMKHEAKTPSQKKKRSKAKTDSNEKTACKKTKLNAEITTQEKMETRPPRTEIEKEIGVLIKRKRKPTKKQRKLNKRRPETKHEESNTMNIARTGMESAPKDELKGISIMDDSSEVKQVMIETLEDKENMELPNNEEYIPLLTDNKSIPLLDKKSMDANPTYYSNLYSLFIADCLEDTSDDDDDKMLDEEYYEMLDEEYDETFKQENDSPERSSEYPKGEFSALLEKNEIDICCLDSSFADKYSDLMNVQTSDLACTSENIQAFTSKYSDSMNVQTSDLACTSENIQAFTSKYSDLMNVQTSDVMYAAENISASSSTKPHLPFDIEVVEINSSDIDFLNEL